MFTTPRLEKGEDFPAFPGNFPEDLGLFEVLGVPKLDSPQDPIKLLADFAMANWIGRYDSEIPNLTEQQQEVVRQLGMLDPIYPTREGYDSTLVDGGSKPVYDYRLDFVDALVQDGLITGSIIVFGGQRLRCEADDRNETLEAQARQLTTLSDPWVQSWLEHELSKGQGNSNAWQDSFATEHEVAILALIERYGDKLKKTNTLYRSNPASVRPDIPPALVHSEEFDLGGIKVQVLNAPAIEREFRGERFPATQPRPTGRSCFTEWIRASQPAAESSALLVTHNPHIYRSWFDLLIGAKTIGRQDMYLEGAGAAIEPGRSQTIALQDLGRLLIDFCDHPARTQAS